MPKQPTSYELYFKITDEYQDKYGKSAILFYQVGAFFEMYAIQTKTGEIITPYSRTSSKASPVEEFTQIAQLNISSKEIETDEGTVIMAGFRDYSLDKYLKISTQNGFTAVVYTQNMTNPKNITRELYGVYSPGTFISYDTDSSPNLSNHIVCIWLSKFSHLSVKTPQFICGMASAHIFTGESTLFEYQTGFIMNPTTFDEIERYISIMAPSEAIIISHLSEKETNQVIQYSGLRTSTIHKIIMDKETNLKKIEEIENCQKQKYISNILSRFFGEEAFSICKEFNTNIIATQAFCYLANFLKEHNPDLVRKLAIPHFQNSGKRMVLANHTLKQLNIIDDDTHDGKKSGKYSSVLSFLNNCCTPMGRRNFQTQLTNPVFDSIWLNKEYQNTDILLRTLINEPDILCNIRRNLNKMRDIEKIARQIIVNRVYPKSIFSLYESIQIIFKMNEEHPVFSEIFEESHKFICETSHNVLKFIDSFLIIDRCKGIENTFNENIIREGVCENLDKIVSEYRRDLDMFDKIRKTFNEMMKATDKKGEDIDYIKLHETEKSGSSLQITRKRGETLRKVLQQMKEIVFSADFIIPVKDIRFIKASGANDEIEFPQLNAIARRILLGKEKMSDEIARSFNIFLRTFEKDCFNNLDVLIKWITKIDLLQCKTYIAREYNYSRPIINDTAEQSFFDAKEIRHVLIEQIQQNEIYVSNDLSLSKGDKNGILIFGTNAVGKTSFIRSIGICIIMAQSGIYVPCLSFVYKPYTAIFSRILGNDNIFKGLSTFAVEMSELRIILKNANENSLVLGDELCSGTENESALAIFCTSLCKLDKMRATYLFATHFHEITEYDEIRGLDTMGLKHMTVHYNAEIDGLIYDRKLKDGQGTRMYGLEVCKSLYMDSDFLEEAYAFRNKYFDDQKGELGFKPAVYNRKKIRGYCELCEEKLAEEIHHLSPQKLADKDGFIGGFNKNHTANLAGLCEKCHNKIHMEDKTLEKRKTTRGYKLLL